MNASTAGREDGLGHRAPTKPGSCDVGARSSARSFEFGVTMKVAQTRFRCKPPNGGLAVMSAAAFCLLASEQDTIFLWLYTCVRCVGISSSEEK